jgi:hypothetical protein
MKTDPRPRRSWPLALALTLASCAQFGGGEASWPPLAKKWFDRAEVSYRQGDIEDAEHSIGNALRVMPKEPKVRLLASRIALAQLEYDRTIQLLDGVADGEARSVRGRALWYSGQIDRAADELELLLSDPEVRDAWAVEVAKLARRGAGRKPFQMSGGMLAVVEMPQVASTALVVPVEVNGEPALGLLHTGTAEAVVDSGAGREPQWVSLRFGERVEVKDVPALSKDLSGISRQLNAPIKMLIGVNLLRHLHPTFDFTGGQFVVRNFEPPPPPHATTVRLSYVRGGGMLLRGMFGSEQTSPVASLLIDTSMSFPLALDDGGWKKAGIDASQLKSVPNVKGLKQGTLPLLRLGAFDVPKIPGVHGAPVAEVENGLGMELDGLVGSGLLAAFRVTLVDGGRTMWLEDMPMEAVKRAAPPPSLPEGVEPEAEPEEPEEPEEAPAPKGPGKKPAPGKAAPAPKPKAPPAPAPEAAAPAPASGANPPAAAPKAAPAGAAKPGAKPPQVGAGAPTTTR